MGLLLPQIFCRPSRGLGQVVHFTHDWRRGLSSGAAPRLVALAKGRRWRAAHPNESANRSCGKNLSQMSRIFWVRSLVRLSSDTSLSSYQPGWLTLKKQKGWIPAVKRRQFSTLENQPPRHRGGYNQGPHAR